MRAWCRSYAAIGTLFSGASGMTKPRPPVSIENTLLRVLGEITIERAAEVTGRAESYLRALSDHDKREFITARDIELLDLEHNAQRGEGFPIYEALGRRLQTARAERFTDAAANGRNAIALARESGEAIAALMAAVIDAGDPKLLEHALRELEDAHVVSASAISCVRDQLARANGGPAP
jgi:hypothetical protein